MKVLHTSDFHIGKKLEGRDRLDEQKAVLDEIALICKEKDVDVVVISGDVYDTYTPSAEAEDLFYDSLINISNQKAQIIICAGNHDDYKRLCAASELASRNGIYIFGTNRDKHRIKESQAKCKAISSGEGYIVMQKGEEKVFFGVVGYPSENRYKEKIDENEGYSERVARWISEVMDKNTEGLPSVLVSHLFILGGQKTESERDIELGGTRVISPELLPDCNYVALGHLHKNQRVSKSKNAYYSGSIFQCAFDEEKDEKSVNLVEIKNGESSVVERIYLTKYKRLKRLTVEGFENVENSLLPYKDTYVELTLKSDKPLLYSESKTLSSFGEIAKLILQIKPSDLKQNDTYLKREMSHLDLFKRYYKEKQNCEPDDEMVNLYATFMQEIIENETK